MRPIQFIHSISHNCRHRPHFFLPHLLPSPLPLALTSVSKAFSTDVNEIPTITESSFDMEETQKHTQIIQNSIQSRRTVSYFQTSMDHTKDSSITKPNMLQAIHRAIECAMTAPNHKRTEPSSFKLLSSSESIQSLARVCYHVTLFNQMKMAQSNEKNVDIDTIAQMEKAANGKAEKKRIRWQNEIPFYLVALTSGQPNQDADNHFNKTASINLQNDWESFIRHKEKEKKDRLLLSEEEKQYWFKRLDFKAPTTERQLEDVSIFCIPFYNNYYHVSNNKNLQLSFHSMLNIQLVCKYMCRHSKHSTILTCRT